MSIDTLRAAQAYAQTQNLNSAAPQSSNNAPEQFAELVSNALEQNTQNLQNFENNSAATLTGEANLVDVVTAVSAAEVSLEAAIAVRNRMIEAYQEIMRMPI